MFWLRPAHYQIYAKHTFLDLNYAQHNTFKYSVHLIMLSESI